MPASIIMTVIKRTTAGGNGLGWAASFFLITTVSITKIAKATIKKGRVLSLLKLFNMGFPPERIAIYMTIRQTATHSSLPSNLLVYDTRKRRKIKQTAASIMYCVLTIVQTWALENRPRRKITVGLREKASHSSVVGNLKGTSNLLDFL